MTKCPKCQTEQNKPDKIWNYKQYIAHFHVCPKCGTKFREYTVNGKHGFTLMLKDGKYRKP